jgi:citrate lyase subunit beta/citryl-CoA lyase
MTPRSYLFVPGDRPERFDKAAAAGAHAIILDLEDAVAPDRKDAARDAVAAWLDARGAAVGGNGSPDAAHSAGPHILVRINTEDTAWFARDCAIVGRAAVHAVMMPKSQDTEVLKALASHLRADQLIVPLIETVKGWDIARTLASQAKVQRLAFGSVDFNADAGTSGDGDALDLVRSQLVMASRLAGVLPPVDGVSLALDDLDALTTDVRRARRFGFGGKLCVHPKQVAGINAGFAPSAEEVAWARRVHDAVAAQGLGAIAVDGKLVDRPVYVLAQTILANAHAGF